MAVEFFGSVFRARDPWGPQESWMIECLLAQIEQRWPDENNLVVNTTWLGPLFDSWQQLVDKPGVYDNLFWIAIVDPLCMSKDDLAFFENKFNVKQSYYLGLGFESEHYFNSSSVAVVEDFPAYTEEELSLSTIKYPYVCYNRKPKPHRIDLVNKLIENNLVESGIVTLGDSNVDYDITDGAESHPVLVIEEDLNQYTYGGKYNYYDQFGGIPLDVCSLGRLDIWQNHFLNVVSETVFYPWDNMFVTEKTWKPILGLRPFILNGQTLIYQWLRDNGFRTFNQYWDFVDLENCNEMQIHDNIVQVLKYVCNLPETALDELYKQMLPDLQHNRQRFFEYANEQKQRIQSLF